MIASIITITCPGNLTYFSNIFVATDTEVSYPYGEQMNADLSYFSEDVKTFSENKLKSLADVTDSEGSTLYKHKAKSLIFYWIAISK
ncbi:MULTISPECIES: hypothetical protein [unclassified Lysinibacillus]|uniref:hypothetical protein n=1 Tax=unclassified Lysinibacillus TaxID=2636778 RepID=UPI002554DFFB|nr:MULTISPECIES: hypothetical protein [unclassified Lysinibacillus]MDM5248570.1 hypothetical protein [Lysinibacillus sp. G4S2]